MQMEDDGHRPGLFVDNPNDPGGLRVHINPVFLRARPTMI